MRSVHKSEILIYHAGALGDFITVLPVPATLRESRPDDRLVLLGRKAHGELALEAGLLDEVWDLDRGDFAGLFADRPSDRLGARFKVFDLALVFASPRSTIVNTLKSAGVDEIRAQSPFPRKRRHVVDYHLSLLKGLAPPPNNPVPSLDPRPRKHTSTVGTAGRPRKATVVLHPGSGGFRKNWALEQFIELSQHLEKQGRDILWIRGPAEWDLVFPPHAAVAHTPSVLDLARLLSKVSLFVGNDSGVTHLAAACKCPTIALFGPSDPAVWAPRGARVHIIDAAPPCRPCHPTGNHTKECKERCMARISVAEVLKVCLNHLS
ncbi:MAG: hypothetical protein GF344_10245 [Chitinivibrionales bacterium]|nr:hypothetical protein [Chitinivibrionales bacterium]MBD3357209.1 hypothetical protein [Chitinivibrionales bacterium]